VNAELPPGSGAAVFRAVWSNTLLPALDAFEPQLVLVSAGFDGHHLDPLADLRLDAADYHWLSPGLAPLAHPDSQGPPVSVPLPPRPECSAANLRGLA